MSYLRALIVGVDAYLNPRFPELDGPVNDGIQFARWLVTALNQAQIEKTITKWKIDAYFSRRPGDTSPLPAEVTEHAAVKAELESAVYDSLIADPPDILCLFWGGHGMMNPTGRRVLFFSDVNSIEHPALDLEGILRTWRADLIGGNGSLVKVVVIVDACANYAALAGSSGRITTKNFAIGGNERPQRKQFVMLGVGMGEYAENLDRGTGLFSERFLKALENKKLKDLIDTPQILANKLISEFDELKIKGEVDQVPTYFAFRNWGAEEDFPWGTLSLSELDRIHPTLAVARTELVELLEIVEPMRAIPFNDCVQAFKRIWPVKDPPPAGDSCFRNCLIMMAKGWPKEMLMFLTLCHPLFSKNDGAKIKEWQNKLSDEKKLLLEEIAREQQKSLVPKMEKGRLVQVVVEPIAGALKGDISYKLHLVVASQEKNGDPLFYRCSEARSEIRLLETDFSQYFSNSWSVRDPGAKLVIEFAVPRELLGCPVETWKIEDGEDFTAVGSYFAVALRSYDRHYRLPKYEIPLSRLREKWKLLGNGMKSDSLLRLDDSQVKWTDKRYLGLCVLKIEVDAGGEAARRFFDSIIGAGLPVAMWLHGHMGSPETAWPVIERRFLEKKCVEWLEEAQPFRSGKIDSELPCSGMTILLDNPDQPLPDLNPPLYNHIQP